jgi:hypothetical protein
MLDKDLDYNDAVNLVADVDNSPQPNKIVVLSIKKVLSEGTMIKQYHGEEAEKRIDAVSMLVPYNPEEMKNAKHAPEALPTEKSSGFGRFGKRKAAQPQQPAAPQQELPSASQQPKSRAPGPLDTFAENASRELKRIVPEKPKHEESAQAVGASEMVMPTLSLPDQITELDRIDTGLNGNVFNNEQLKLISMEVKALRESSAKEKDMKIDGNLVAIRDQKLKAVGKRLGQTG